MIVGALPASPGTWALFTSEEPRDAAHAAEVGHFLKPVIGWALVPKLGQRLASAGAATVEVEGLVVEGRRVVTVLEHEGWFLKYLEPAVTAEELERFGFSRTDTAPAP